MVPTPWPASPTSSPSAATKAPRCKSSTGAGWVTAARTTCTWMARWAGASTTAAVSCSRAATWIGRACYSAKSIGCARPRAASATRRASTCLLWAAPWRTPIASATPASCRPWPTAARCAASTSARKSPRCPRRSGCRHSPGWTGRRPPPPASGPSSATPATPCGATCRRASPCSTRRWCRPAIRPTRSARTCTSKDGRTASATRRSATITSTTPSAWPSAWRGAWRRAWRGTRASCGARTTPC